MCDSYTELVLNLLLNYLPPLVKKCKCDNISEKRQYYAQPSIVTSQAKVTNVLLSLILTPERAVPYKHRYTVLELGDNRIVFEDFPTYIGG